MRCCHYYYPGHCIPNEDSISFPMLMTPMCLRPFRASRCRVLAIGIIKFAKSLFIALIKSLYRKADVSRHFRNWIDPSEGKHPKIKK